MIEKNRGKIQKLKKQDQNSMIEKNKGKIQ